MKPELKKAIDNVFGSGQGAAPFYQTKALALMVEQLESSIRDLRESIDRNADSSSRLSKRVFWLNLVLTAATVIGTAVLVWGYIYPHAG